MARVSVGKVWTDQLCAHWQISSSVSFPIQWAHPELWGLTSQPSATIMRVPEKCVCDKGQSQQAEQAAKLITATLPYTLANWNQEQSERFQLLPSFMTTL